MDQSDRASELRKLAAIGPRRSLAEEKAVRHLRRHLETSVDYIA